MLCFRDLMAVTMVKVMFSPIFSNGAPTVQQFPDPPWRPPKQWEWPTRETYPDPATQPERCKNYEQQPICDPNKVIDNSTGKIMHEISHDILTQLMIAPVLS